MSEFNPYQRVEDDDPRRCQAVIPTVGQCHLISFEGSTYCINHGGKSAAQAAEKKVLNNYRIQKYQQRIDEKSQSDQLKSLRDEIAILRMLIEERLNSCRDSHDLMLYSGPIADLVMKVDKVVNSCNRLEVNLGVMLDKTQALQFAAEIVEAVGRHVEDQEALVAISDEITNVLARIGQPKSR
jgi:hypothetical protein